MSTKQLAVLIVALVIATAMITYTANVEQRAKRIERRVNMIDSDLFDLKLEEIKNRHITPIPTPTPSIADVIKAIKDSTRAIETAIARKRSCCTPAPAPTSNLYFTPFDYPGIVCATQTPLPSLDLSMNLKDLQPVRREDKP